MDYAAKLNWFLPAAMIPALAIVATAAEILLGLLLGPVRFRRRKMQFLPNYYGYTPGTDIDKFLERDRDDSGQQDDR